MSLTLVNTPIVENETLTNANEEYSFVIPAGTQHAEVKARTSASWRIAFVSGKVAAPTAPYETVPAGGTWTMPAGKAMSANVTVYVASATAGIVLERERWN
mgnify:CR=1 FL=1